MATTPEYIEKEWDKRTNVLVEDCITLRTKLLRKDYNVIKEMQDIKKIIEMIGYDVECLK